MAINMGIVASEFNYDITYAMLELAKEHAKFLGVNVTTIAKVPGVFDMPLAVKKVLERKDVDVVVTLGAVIEGQTEHDEIVIQHAARKIVDLSLDYDKPVALGIAGPGMTRLEAHKRVEYAKRAVEAAVKSYKAIKEIEKK
ncbi:MAG: 6,7-dimethyl-8-ribityllumazine synthase [Candidatus Altiarchaeota archaeon]|nr:6,7-dimethyl-8-ribityllumazine synthase [Candidatus Altiarchaeota archaeon]